MILLFELINKKDFEIGQKISNKNVFIYFIAERKKRKEQNMTKNDLYISVDK